jgi:hypothetical protein
MGATSDMKKTRDETFSRVGTVIQCGDVNEATALSPPKCGRAQYGSTDGIAIGPALPWDGMRTSGIGRELGCAGIEADAEEQTITVVL